MARQQTITVQVLSDTSKFSIAKVNKELDSLDTKSTKSGRALEKFGSGIQKSFVPAIAAVGAIGVGFKKFVGDAEEATRAQNALNNVFKSIGFEENAQAASDYADELSKVIGVDDEIIKGGQTILATFSQVAASQETMARATKLNSDLTASGFGDVNSNAKMLGKALQDPIKGISALTKAGVTFTDEQKEQIKVLTESGDILGAQAIILGEVEKQVGGTAEASATASDKLSVAFGEVGEAVGAVLLPAFEALAPKLQAFADWAAANPDVLLIIAGVVGTIATAIIAMNVAMKAWAVISGIVTAVNYILGTSFTIALGPVLLIIAAIAAVIAIGVLLYKNWDKISAWLKKTWESIKQTAIKVWDGIKDWFAKTWNAIKDKVTSVWNGIKTWLSDTWNSLKEKVSSAFNAMKDAVKNALDKAFEFIKSLPGKILSAYANFYTFLFQKGWDLIKGLLNGIKDMWGTARDWLSGIPAKAKSALSGIGSALYSAGKSMIQGLINGIKSMGGAIVDAIMGLIPGPLKGAVGKVVGLFRGADFVGSTMMMRDIGIPTSSGSSYYLPINPSVATGKSDNTATIVNYNVEVKSMVADRNAGRLITQAIKEHERTVGRR